MANARQSDKNVRRRELQELNQDNIAEKVEQVGGLPIQATNGITCGIYSAKYFGDRSGRTYHEMISPLTSIYKNNFKYFYLYKIAQV
jgi:hypothetical protein